jgi:hypothetical protein
MTVVPVTHPDPPLSGRGKVNAPLTRGVWGVGWAERRGAE